ncbi:MAG: DUF2764 family protein [Phycisphaerales bacterium]|nr:DUF2764 family protein [Phycisphaerales bacterium]
MTAANRYYVTALPVLGELGSEAPFDRERMLQHVADLPDAHALVTVLFLEDDLLEREAFLAGEIKEVRPVVLTEAQVRNESPLPDYLVSSLEHESAALTADRLWEAYFGYASGVAKEQGSEFLATWVRDEVGRRNALAAARARRLGLREADSLVAVELGEAAEEYQNLVAEWLAAANPLAGLQLLMADQWAWLGRHDRWFTFANDELAAYAARLMLLERWQRVTRESEGGRES